MEALKHPDKPGWYAFWGRHYGLPDQRMVIHVTKWTQLPNGDVECMMPEFSPYPNYYYADQFPAKFREQFDGNWYLLTMPWDGSVR